MHNSRHLAAAAATATAGQAPLLSPEQQQFVQKKILPTAVDLTPQALQATLAAAQTPEQKVAALKAYMDAAQASGKPVPPELQNAFAQQLQELSVQTPNMTPAQRAQFATLAAAATTATAGQAPLLSPEQQQFVQKEILPTAVDLTPQALQATLAAAQTPEQKVAALKAYMDAAQASGQAEYRQSYKMHLRNSCKNLVCRPPT